MSCRRSLACAAAALALLPAGAAAKPEPDDEGVAPARTRGAGVAFDDRASDRLVLTTPAYRLVLRKRNGALLELVDRAAGAAVVRGSSGCLWAAEQADGTEYVGGCVFRPGGERRFSYAWARSTSTLTLRYRDLAAGGVDAVVTLAAARSSFDLRATVENRSGVALRSLHLPAALRVDRNAVQAGYAPTYLPGVRLAPEAFAVVGSNVLTYPSRWAFADYLALDVAGGHLALAAVSPERPAPADLGFVHAATPGPCSGPSFCAVHAFQTWIGAGESWTSPVVRIHVGRPVEETIAAYRADNGIDAYPSLAEKVGARLPALARAPLVKANLPKLMPFAEWAAELRRLPVPSLVHPVAFQPRGHDENDPDFLPPDPQWGTTADFRAAAGAARALGLLVMPYLNVTWWDEDSPTLQALPPARRAEVALVDEAGAPVRESYGDSSGIVTSPFAPLVRERVSTLMEEWRTEVPSDCLFFDQLGARRWRRDFNPAAPGPLAYHDGWLTLFEPYRDRCLMVEDGWDRLARDYSGFHGSALMMAREHDEPDERFGEGNWEPYPLATWLLHDKVLFYQHDLYEGTMTTDLEVLSWNMAFGLISSYSWDAQLDTLASPWLELVGAFQRAVGPHYAGVPLASWRETASGLRESRFGDLVVTASRDAGQVVEVEGHGIAPQGFLARTADGGLLAGAFAGTFGGVALTPGTHFVIVERGEQETTVRQLLGADTELAVEPPTAWRAGQPLVATAFARDGTSLGSAVGAVRDGRFVLRYAGAGPIAGYRIAVAGG